MGAFSIDNFDNDDAADWLADLAEPTATLQLAAALKLDDSGYLEAPQCSVALAAAEIVAALGGHPSSSLPDKAAAIVDRLGVAARPALTHAAIRAVKLVAQGSELQELWDETEDAAAWHQLLRDLQSRLV